MSVKSSKSFALPGSTRYDFGRLIGSGGNGAVYAATDRQTGAPVAIKVLKQTLMEDPKSHYRFAAEFRACQQLEHPNIVRAFDFVTDGSTSFVVYELIEGESLGERVQRSGRLPEAEAIGIVAQMTQALQYAHDRKVIHRDVKPDNILLRADGVAKLTDFGLAKDYNNDQDLTRPAGGLGTPAYMAPEQFAGAKYADARCDVYSLAATLYDLLTGKPPFEGKMPLAVLTKKERLQFTPAGDLVPGLSPTIDAAVTAALDPNPDLRPATCLEFFRRLTTVGPVSSDRYTVPDDRRLRARFSVQLGSACRVAGDDLAEPDEATAAWPMLVHDVSAAGVGFVLARRFEPGTELLASLSPRPDSAGGQYPLRVVRVTPAGAGRWNYGCEFSRPLSRAELVLLVGVQGKSAAGD